MIGISLELGFGIWDLQKFQPRQILRIDNPDRDIVVVNND